MINIVPTLRTKDKTRQNQELVQKKLSQINNILGSRSLLNVLLFLGIPDDVQEYLKMLFGTILWVRPLQYLRSCFQQKPFQKDNKILLPQKFSKVFFLFKRAKDSVFFVVKIYSPKNYRTFFSETTIHEASNSIVPLELVPFRYKRFAKIV